MLSKAWGWVRTQLDYLDVVVAAVLGLVFTVLGLIDKANGEALAQAAIALLALLAFSLIRDRRARERLETMLQTLEAGFQTTGDAIKATVAEMAEDFPYHTRRFALEWDIEAPDGSLAYFKSTREIRFTRNNVVTIIERSSGEGRVADHSIEGGPKGEPRAPLEQISRLRDERGRFIDIVSLGRQWKFGELMEVVTRRTLKNSFRDRRSEYVGLEIVGPTDEVEIRIVWPQGVDPRGLRLARQGGPTVSLERLHRQPDGRMGLDHKIADPHVGETMTLHWGWDLQA
jgi:hypothetical protein